MSDENMLAYAVKQKKLIIMKKFGFTTSPIDKQNDDGHVMVEKVSKDANSYAAGKYYIPGVAMHFGEHPEEAGHRILTEELEVLIEKLFQ